MSLWDRLFAKSDPTREWTAQPGLKVLLDLDKHTLCGIRLGDPVDRVSRLGTPDNLRPTKYEDYAYDTLGFDIGAREGMVTGFTLLFDPEAAGFEEDVRPFGGGVRWRGESCKLSSDTRAAQFIERFGEPYWTDRDDDEILLFYEFGEVEWQVEFGADERLVMMIIVTPPLMADAEQRENYGVDKPWPPPAPS